MLIFIVMIVCIYMLKPLILRMCCNIITLWSLADSWTSRWHSRGNVLCLIRVSVSRFQVRAIRYQFAKAVSVSVGFFFFVRGSLPHFCFKLQWKTSTFAHQPETLEQNHRLNILKSSLCMEMSEFYEKSKACPIFAWIEWIFFLFVF